MQFKFIISDIQSGAILCATDSISCANILAEGVFNLKVIPVPNYIYTRPEWRRDFDTDYLRIDDINGPEISDLAQHLRTEDLDKKRNLLIMRRRYLIRLESFLNVILFKSINTFDSSMFDYVDNQLKLNHSEAIKEYSNFMGISYTAAVNEFSMLIESQGRLKLRLYAVYKKYSRKINLIEEQSSLETTFNEAMKDLFINARF